MKRIRKGDDVIIIAGKDKGKRGSVTRLSGTQHLYVQGINTVKKHQKPDPSTGATGGIVNIDKPIHISNVAIYNFSAKKADKVGFQVDENNKKVRIFRSTGEKI